MPPVNDNLANATVLSGASGSLGGTLVGSTLENGPWTLEVGWTELTYWGAATVNDGRSAIYKRTPATDESLQFDIAGSGFNPYVEIYRDLGPGNDMEFVDWFGDGTADPPISGSIDLLAGETYYLLVWNWEFDTSEGTFTLAWNVAVPPPNDLIANAIRIFSGDTVVGTTLLATLSADESAKGIPQPAVWYKYKAPSLGVSTRVTILSTEKFQNLRMYVSNVGDAADDANADLGSNILSLNLVPGDPPHNATTSESGWVYIAVYPNGDQGTFSFSVAVEVENDEVDNPEFLPTVPRGWWGGNNVGNTTNGSDPTVEGVTPHHSVWYELSLQHVGEYTFEIERVWGDIADPLLLVVLDPFGTPTVIAESADTPLPSVTFIIDAANRGDQIGIMIAVREEGQLGGFQFAWSLPSAEPNDDFADATALGSSGSIADKSFDGSMQEIGDYQLIGFSGGGGNHWYKLEPTDDGSLELTTEFSALNAQNIVYVWKGTVREELVAIGKLTWGSGALSKIMKLPIEGGETYYIEVHGGTSYTYDISWELNTDTPIDFQPTDVSDFDTNNGASWSSGELVCGPGDYVQHTVFPSGHSRATDSLLIGFNVRHGNANRIIPASGDVSIHLLEVYTVTNVLVGSVRIFEDLSSFYMTGNLTIDALSIHKLGEDNLYVELLVRQDPADDYATTNKRLTMIVQGSDFVPDLNPGYSTALLGYIKLGYINEPSTGPNLDLRFSDIRVKSILHDASLPDPPFYMSPKDRLFRASGFSEGEHAAAKLGTGFRNTEMATGYAVIDDPTGGGRGKVIDGSAAAESVSVPATGTVGACFGWWTYITTLGSGGAVFTLNGTEKGTLNSSFASMSIGSDGRMYVQLPGSAGVRAYSHRAMETGSWHHIEIEVTRILPRVEGRWWIDGEEQEPFFEDRGRGRIWGYTTSATIALGSALRGYITDVTGSLKGPIGPVKTAIIKPDASGAHALGVVVNYTEDSGTETFFTSTDDGTTITSLGPTDPVHGFIDEWPNNDSTTTSDMVGDANRDSYIEYSYEDVDSGDDVLFVNAFTVVRPMHIMRFSFSGLQTFTDLQPHSRDQSDGGAMVSHSRFVLGDNEIIQRNLYQDGFDQNYKVSQAPMGHDPNGALWTPSSLASLVAQWGYQHFFSIQQQGNALEAQMMEVVAADDPGATLGVWTPPAPEIFLLSQFFDGDNPPFQLTSCDAWPSSYKGTDPNMRQKIWMFPTFSKEWDNFKLYWRVTPAYDDALPNLDGAYAMPGVLETWLWTTGDFYGDLRNRPDQDAVRWINNYVDSFGTGDIRVVSAALVYDMCALGPFVDEDGKVTFEAYIEDYYGVQSSVASVVVQLLRGLCCGAPYLFMAYRAHDPEGAPNAGYAGANRVLSGEFRVIEDDTPNAAHSAGKHMHAEYRAYEPDV